MTPPAAPINTESPTAQAGGPVLPPDFAPVVPKPTLGLAWRTLRHLSVTQLGRLARRRLWPRTGRPHRIRGAVSLARLPRVPQFPEWRPAAARQMIRSLRFDFLHLTSPPGEGIPWSPAAISSTQYPRLWLYHLNYCDFLNVDLTRPGDEGDLRAALAIALHWLERNRTGSEVGWEPYPLSLRIVNWLKFLVRHQDRIESLGERRAAERLVTSIAEQTATLERRVEYHLRGNHLLKNIKALLFAGILLESAESRRWWRTGAFRLERELDEQILPDGGHFERSPMYHLQVLEDLIDLQELSAASGRSLGPAARLAERIEAMATFARTLSHPDGEIPLFNDSALSMARPLAEVLALAERCLATESNRPIEPTPEPEAITEFPETGYAVIRDPTSNSALIFDCGPLGPDYNPGHGHCDVLSYELSLYGQRVVTDTGVSTYERGPERHYERSTAAHNTLRVDGEEQAEIWASFRVGH
ncbi:MAG TPA: alginate lyase family protein, partial [Terriglobia bacterium]|nr:alginate lyase family protein [Terriglobia bacterium]